MLSRRYPWRELYMCHRSFYLSKYLNVFNRITAIFYKATYIFNLQSISTTKNICLQLHDLLSCRPRMLKSALFDRFTSTYNIIVLGHFYCSALSIEWNKWLPFRYLPWVLKEYSLNWTNVEKGKQESWASSLLLNLYHVLHEFLYKKETNSCNDNIKDVICVQLGHTICK